MSNLDVLQICFDFFISCLPVTAFLFLSVSLLLGDKCDLIHELIVSVVFINIFTYIIMIQLTDKLLETFLVSAMIAMFVSIYDNSIKIYKSTLYSIVFSIITVLIQLVTCMPTFALFGIPITDIEYNQVYQIYATLLAMIPESILIYKLYVYKNRRIRCLKKS